jgi:hypothetical protein
LKKFFSFLSILLGLTHSALVGLQKQSVLDAERLLSHRMASFMERHDYQDEAEFLRAVAAWHEASDGRGLSQLQRCKANYVMLNYLLDEWMPWHQVSYDFSLIDINRYVIHSINLITGCIFFVHSFFFNSPMVNIRGLTYQTLIEVTSNIESQELRRCQNSSLGYQEHPRAGTTDDVEGFFSLCRSLLGGTFTLRDFKLQWRKIVRYVI